MLQPKKACCRRAFDAINSDHPDCIKNEVVNLTIRNGGHSLFRLALERGAIKVARFLIKYIDDLDTFFDRWPRLLADLLEQGQIDTTKLILSYGYDISKINCPQLLIRLVQREQNEAVELILSHGYNIDEVGPNGNTPLHLACKEGYSITLLLRYGADVNERNYSWSTPLHLCINPDHVDQLIDAGADLTAANYHGYSPLHQACEKGRKSVVERLLRRGADPNSRAGPQGNGDTPLHLTWQEGHDFAMLLLQHGADPTMANSHGDTPLIHLIHAPQLSAYQKYLALRPIAATKFDLFDRMTQIIPAQLQSRPCIANARAYAVAISFVSALPQVNPLLFGIADWRMWRGVIQYMLYMETNFPPNP